MEVAKPSNLPSDLDKYGDIRKQVKTATKRKYCTFIKNLQDNLKDNPKQFWSFYRAKTKAASMPRVVNLGREKASTSLQRPRYSTNMRLLRLISRQ